MFVSRVRKEKSQFVDSWVTGLLCEQMRRSAEETGTVGAGAGEIRIVGGVGGVGDRGSILTFTLDWGSILTFTFSSCLDVNTGIVALGRKELGRELGGAIFVYRKRKEQNPFIFIDHDIIRPWYLKMCRTLYMSEQVRHYL